jgi:hypothetical protein
MKYIKFWEYTDRLIAFKKKDPEMYISVCNHCLLMGVLMGLLIAAFLYLSGILI